jgi:excisionase family DNA binding protein
MKSHVSEPARLLTQGELAEYLKVHPATIYRLLKTRQLPTFKVGGDWRFDREQIDQGDSNVRRDPPGTNQVKP